jgi:formylglycine-generating enzyme required for sulfatase activity
VANSVLVIAPTRGTDYGIDATEVTQGQYDAWLATSPPLPAGTDADCGYVTSYAEHGTGYAGPNADHHPVVYVDWCDASQYCAGVGKNLCGLISGGATDFYTGTANASTNQWYRVCTSGDINAYPYGNTYQASTCDGYDYWGANTSTATTLAVGSLNGCVTSAIGYAGIYDLSGNVSEWQYSCNTSGPMASCKVQGGSFSNATNSSALTCSGATGNFRNAAYSYIGFRCCSS